MTVLTVKVSDRVERTVPLGRTLQLLVFDIRINEIQYIYGGELARKKRQWYEGTSYHLMGRGNRHGVIFREPDMK